MTGIAGVCHLRGVKPVRLAYIPTFSGGFSTLVNKRDAPNCDDMTTLRARIGNRTSPEARDRWPPDREEP